MENTKRSAALAALGITLQALGSVCLFLSTLGVMREVNTHLKKAVIRELSKNLE